MKLRFCIGRYRFSSSRLFVSLLITPVSFHTHGQQILVVDDAPPIREMVRLALKRAGYEVQEAGSVLEAREAISSCTPT